MTSQGRNRIQVICELMVERSFVMGLSTVFLVLLNLAKHPAKSATGEFAVAELAFTGHVDL